MSDFGWCESSNMRSRDKRGSDSRLNHPSGLERGDRRSGLVHPQSRCGVHIPPPLFSCGRTCVGWVDCAIESIESPVSLVPFADHIQEIDFDVGHGCMGQGIGRRDSCSATVVK